MANRAKLGGIRPIGEFVKERAQRLLKRIRLDRKRVPSSLWELVPIAERWGLRDGAAREVAYQRATRAERAAVTRALKGRHECIEDFLYENDSPTPEQVCFTNLLVFELEYLKGPGIRGRLDYAAQRLRRDVGAALARFDEQIDRNGPIGRDFPWQKPALREAQKLRRAVARCLTP